MEDFKQCDIKIIDSSEIESPRGDKLYSTPGWQEVQELIDKLNQCFKNEQENFCYICYYLYELKKRFDSYDKTYYGRYFDSNKNFVFYETVCKCFGIEFKTAERYINIFKKFMFLDNVVPKLGEAFFGFSYSKLDILCSVSDAQLNKDLKSGKLNCNMTVKQIREYVKSLKGKPANKVIEENSEEEEVPIDKCQQYVVFSLDDFEFIKNIVLDKKNKLNDTSAVISAMIKYFKNNNIKL